ncbi:fructosamine kinase family protein [Microbacterium sp.]|uniref:fructosamine kinase family protein n=1 Tax=Microbacterium sp. TaxID=51671 RepID=UPI0039E62F11
MTSEPPTFADWPAHLPPPTSGTRLDGGWIAATWRCRLADGREVVVKHSPHPAEGEADGLAALRAAGVPTPEVIAVSGDLLVLALVDGAPDWGGLGAAIARMHRTTGDRYGWHRDNHAGRFAQTNTWSDHWPSFFAEHRVRAHLRDPEVPRELRLRLERACDGPIQELLPAAPPPSLTHGDLGHGNIVAGRWVIDPEVCFADRELDLAFMLSARRNPLPPEFWAAYQDVWPIPDDFDERRLVLGLHHRLLQVRHFGSRCLADLDDDLSALGWN